MIVTADLWKNYRGVWPWPNFSPGEMADRNSGELYISSEFMDWLQEVRIIYGRPMIINSGHRTSMHQFIETGRYTGAHVDGMAADVGVYGQHAHELLKIAFDKNVLGVGVRQDGPIEKRYLHLDRWFTAPEEKRPMLWTYS